MKPKGTAIGNPRSFENGDFNFKEYNAAAGPDNSGKTNPLRVLRMPASGDFLDLGATREIKFDQGKKPPAKPAVGAADLETRMVLQAPMYRHAESEEIPKPRKRPAVILGWPDLGDGLAPDDVTFHLQNGTAATFHFAGRITCYCPPFNTENPERFLDGMHPLRHGETVSGWKGIAAGADRRNTGPMRGALRPDGGFRVPTAYMHGAAAVPRRLKDACTRMAGTRPMELGCGPFPRGAAERWQEGADQKVTGTAEWKAPS